MIAENVRPAASAPARLFGALERQPADALLGLIGLFRQDPRATKIDLGVGVYRDDAGETPVMQAIKAAEHRLAETQPTKAYLGAEGDARFVDLLAPIVFGAALAGDPGLTGVQTPGGTGALRLAAELVARGAGDPKVWIGTPTWPNHAPIFREAGVTVRPHPFFDAASGTVDFAAMASALAEAAPGDVVLLHGCCHNPTGAELDAAQWSALTALVVERGLIPLIDLAYQGLGRGLEDDASATRSMLAAAPEAIVAYSCDKNFGLYRDRVGALWVKADGGSLAAVRDNILVLARSLWSMPPDHGAATVREILEDATLTSSWRRELEEMRSRIAGLRAALADADARLAPLAHQGGMFAMLPLPRDAIFALRASHGIYMAESGRINIAGLRGETVASFVAAIAPYLQR
ncbi:aspartate/tyrosine/aromatic aminotransferase [Sphingomonas populi]|uniref:Aspartate/tyrosine/aromatic aminotransferase n=1 Tax=Sphingomonas populi TaxID=2484750 RepID=A0A4Q6Y137_9SPHN|nr:aromatic amino acid transaminase [Sphingomonas populi]RZF63892.1 aspartate/tyrosine/aromatic aminotransferase [Sphingomonas populi]